MKSFSVVGKLAFIAGLVMLLLIPLFMVRDLIHEREARLRGVQDEIMQVWGARQTLGAAQLVLPYRVTVEDEKGRQLTEIHSAHFLPETLQITGTLVPDVRYRGIFEVPVYTATLQVEGTFDWPDVSLLGVPHEDVVWEDARFFVALSDPSAIRETVSLTWDGRPIAFGPSSSRAAGIEASLRRLRDDDRSSDTIIFSYPLHLAGTERLFVLPWGQETQVQLHSTWAHPSFGGSTLPLTRTVDAQGFQSEWKVLHLGRNYPQRWLGAEAFREEIAASAFGVDLFLPADVYQQTERSTKYGVLFIGLTFLAFFLFEVLARLRVHPFQYLLIGMALCIFYTLVLALAEHLSFATAYGIAALANVGLLTAYSGTVLRARGRAAVIGAIVAALYAYLYILLQAEDYALLLGSVGLFVIVGLVMWITRRIDWYHVGETTPVSQARTESPCK